MGDRMERVKKKEWQEEERLGKQPEEDGQEWSDVRRCRTVPAERHPATSPSKSEQEMMSPNYIDTGSGPHVH